MEFEAYQLTDRKFVVQSAERDQLEQFERAETIAAIRQGMEDADEGRMIPLKDAAAKLRAKHGL